MQQVTPVAMDFPIFLEDAEEDAMLVKQHDDRGRDVDALPYTDDDPVEHTE